MARRRIPGTARLLAPLAAPVVWAACFLAVYLFAEAACAASGLRWAGADAVVVFTLAVTGVALAATAGTVLWSWRARRAGDAGAGGLGEQQELLGVVGMMLGVLFSVAIAVLAIPALVHGPC